MARKVYFSKKLKRIRCLEYYLPCSDLRTDSHLRFGGRRDDHFRAHRVQYEVLQNSRLLWNYYSIELYSDYVVTIV